MFSKKPAGPKAPWAVRMLTPDFLVDGFSDTEAHPESWPFFAPHSGNVPTGMLWLDNPSFLPVTAEASAPPAVSQWVVPYSSNYVAVMPFDMASLAAVRKNAERQKNSFATVLYVGPFSIRGRLLSEYGAVPYLSTMAGHLSLAVQDAEIACRLPNPRMTAFKAPMVLVRTQLLQGIGLLR
jgi:hypothetical protein